MPSSDFAVAWWLTPTGWFHIVIFGLYLPWAALRGRSRFLGSADAPLPDRLRHFRQGAVSLVVLATCSLGAARVHEMSLWPRALPSWPAVVAGVVAYVVAVACMRSRWRRAVQRQPRVAHLFMPSTGRERGWWVVVSLLAGVSEEITWRAVQTGLLTAATGSYPIAAVLSAVSFGATHAVQGWSSAAIVVVFALGFQALVWISGSLYVAMAVHAAYDLTAGLAYGRLGRELGHSLPPRP